MHEQSFSLTPGLVKGDGVRLKKCVCSGTLSPSMSSGCPVACHARLTGFQRAFVAYL